jgi:hypothetical protein
MGWNSWSYGKRGAIIGILFVIVLAILGLVYNLFSLPLVIGQIFFILIDELFIGGTMKNPSFTENIRIGLYLLISILVYSIIGAIIGSIYGKIKNSKR